MKIVKFMVYSLLIVLMTGRLAPAQMELPRVSPNATVSQVIGITTITVDYFRPGVKDRVIWGELVPYDKIWRTGANRATTVSFDTEVMVAGKKVDKGTYSLFTIPSVNEWTVILNSNAELWGAMGYKQDEDVLRFTVKPVAAPFTERMMFYFDDLEDNAATLVLQWENLKIQVPIQVDVQSLVMSEINESVNWQLPYRGADYILEQDMDLEKGQKLLDASLVLEKNYWNTALQARYLNKKGYSKEAVKTMEEALKMGREMERAPFNLTEMEKMLEEWKK
jgi:hypothetical protein